MDNTVLFKLTYGLFMLTAKQDGKDNGCVINTAIQVANNPTRILISCLKPNLTHDMIKATGEFNLSALTEKTPFADFQRFGMQSGRNVDKFADYVDVKRSENGLLYLTKSANMFMSAKVVDAIDLGSHTAFIAEVTDGEVLSDVAPCTYTYYQTAIKPKPQAAPSEKKKWVCKICGYVYEGDELPDDFECPLCHHGKDDFEQM